MDPRDCPTHTRSPGSYGVSCALTASPVVLRIIPNVPPCGDLGPREISFADVKPSASRATGIGRFRQSPRYWGGIGERLPTGGLNYHPHDISYAESAGGLALSPKRERPLERAERGMEKKRAGLPPLAQPHPRSNLNSSSLYRRVRYFKPEF
jgi:hypothetical protein